MFKCSVCDYSTSDRSNYRKHKMSNSHQLMTRHNMAETQNHKMNLNKDLPASCQNTTSMCIQSVSKVYPGEIQEKSSKSYRCAHCGSIFQYHSGLAKHKKKCSEAINEKRELLERLKEAETKAKYLEEKNSNIERIYKDQIESFKELVLETKSKKTSLPALLYEHCEDNPHIAMIDASKLNDLIKPKIRLMREIVSRFKHKILHKFLGDYIVSLYKKDDVLSQSVFSTDSVRMNYMIKELFFDETSNWILDKKGIKTTKYLITPLVEHTRELVDEYSKLLVVDSTKMTTGEMEDVLIQKRALIDILNEIDDGRLASKINKYISPLLKMEKDNMTELKDSKLKGKKKLPELEN